jgi:hypothetical protein
MRREAGARGPQNVAGFTAGAYKLYYSGFHAPFSQQFVTVAAANIGMVLLVHTFLT